MGGSNDARPPPTAIRLSGYPPIRPGHPPTRLRHAQTRRHRRAFRHRPTRDPGAAARRVRDPAARPRHLPIARAAPQDETAGDPRRGPARRGGAPDLRHGDVLRPAPPGALQTEDVNVTSRGRLFRPGGFELLSTLWSSFRLVAH